MKLKIIAFIGYSNIHTVDDIKKELKCTKEHIILLEQFGILEVCAPHGITILTRKGSDIYELFSKILDLSLK